MPHSIEAMPMGDANDQAHPPRPWYSGLCLDGEVAGQYQVEGLAQGEKSPDPKECLLLDDLSPINIFVGANNSGKSRLLRDLYSCIAYT